MADQVVQIQAQEKSYCGSQEETMASTAENGKDNAKQYLFVVRHGDRYGRRFDAAIAIDLLSIFLFRRVE